MALRHMLSRADVVLVVLLLLLAGGSWALLARSHDDTKVAVYADGQLVGRWPLTEDRHLEPKPGVHVEIKDGRYRIAQSCCENQICVKQGWQTVAPVICVPQRVMVVAEREHKESEMMITR